MSNVIEIDDNDHLNLSTLIKVLLDYQRVALLHNQDTDDWKIFIKIDGKEYPAHTIWFNSLEKQKISLCHYTEPRKEAFNSLSPEVESF